MEEDYYELVRINDASEDNFIEYETNGDIDKMLSIKEYLDKIKPCLTGMINDHKAQG